MAKAKTCGRADCACHTKSRAFGAATWLAVLFAVGVVGAALWFSMRDRQGPTAKSSRVTKAWFPEPSFLLAHESDLKLTPSQTRHAQVVDRQWALTKATFDAQFKTLNTDSDSALADLRANRQLQGRYGELARELDEARAKAWADATKNLDAKQLQLAEKLGHGGNAKKVALGRDRILIAYNELSPSEDPYWAQMAELDGKLRQLREDLKAITKKFGTDSKLARQYRQKVIDLTYEKATLKAPVAQYLPVRPYNLRPIPIPLAEPREKYDHLAAPMVTK